jgi:hypothetical protein
LGFTALGMFIMIGVWILNLTQSFGRLSEESEESSLKKVQEDIKSIESQLERPLNGIIENFETQIQVEEDGQSEQEEGSFSEQNE